MCAYHADKALHEVSSLGADGVELLEHLLEGGALERVLIPGGLHQLIRGNMGIYKSQSHTLQCLLHTTRKHFRNKTMIFFTKSWLSGY